MASGVSFSAAAAACELLLATTFAASASAAYQVFVVGGEPRGWRKPGPNDETYNHWAERNRFHVGDFLRFKYDENGSVLVVSREDYKLCNAAKPAQRFEGGDTRFRLDRTGFFYFLSGAPSHCDAGQRLTLRILAAQQDVAPAGAPPAAMSPGDDDGTDEGGYSGEWKPGPGNGGSVSISRPPLPQGSAGGEGRKNSGAASVRAPSLVAGYHVAVGAVLGFVLMRLAH